MLEKNRWKNDEWENHWHENLLWELTLTWRDVGCRGLQWQSRWEESMQGLYHKWETLGSGLAEKRRQRGGVMLSHPCWELHTYM